MRNSTYCALWAFVFVVMAIIYWLRDRIRENEDERQSAWSYGYHTGREEERCTNLQRNVEPQPSPVVPPPWSTLERRDAPRPVVASNPLPDAR